MTSRPSVSVVIVTRGAWALTRRALTALAENTEQPFELIVVDNGSADETRERLSEMPTVSLIANDTNQGFGPAANQGADQAHGDYLVFLNPDAFVHEGWLEPLLTTFGTAEVGAVIPRYLYPDGSLQEAGALLARDGTVMLYGNGGDPGEPWFCFPRSVDYGSAVCMVVPQSTFAELGGFDDRYAPAYYEDVDLCLRLAERGLRVVYQPGSSVTHARHGSGDADAAATLCERNRKVFLGRWGPRLVGRPATFMNATELAAIAARDVLATPRVLVAGALDQMLRQLLEDRPRARITWIAPETTEPEPWLAQGVEVITGDDVQWMDTRLYHYDLVVRADATASRVLKALARTQPQAPSLSVSGAGKIAAVSRALLDAGISPEVPLLPSAA
jgi:GT2 family glycosyltransferase